MLLELEGKLTYGPGLVILKNLESEDPSEGGDGVCCKRGRCLVLGPAGVLRTEHQVRVLGSSQKRIQERARVKGKQVYLEIHIPQAECCPSQKARAAPGRGVDGFYGLSNFIG